MPTIAETGETSETTADARIVDSGQLGTCVWTLDDKGEVVISPQDGVSGTLPAGPLSIPDTATSVRFEGTVRPDGYIGAQYLFGGKASLISVDVTGLDTSGITDFSGMFVGCQALESIEGLDTLDTSSATNMAEMFSLCSSLTTLDVSGFDTSNVTNMGIMFQHCSSLTSLDVSGFQTGSVTDMSSMFAGCSSITFLDVSEFDTSNVTNMGWMFADCVKLEEADVSGFVTSRVTSTASMFCNCYLLAEIDVSGFETENVTMMDWMFSNCSAVKVLDVSGFDTSNVTNMWVMFSGCSSVEELDVSGFETDRVTNMGSMFAGCSSVSALDVSGFETGNVTNFGRMFSGCSSLTSLDVSRFDTADATDISQMFNGCSSLASLEVSGFKTDQVTKMDWLFAECSSLTSVDVSGFDTSNVTSMAAMFRNCSSLTFLDVSSFDTSCVTDMSQMLYGCSGLSELDLSGFDTNQVSLEISERTWAPACDVFESPTIETVTVGKGYTLPFPEASTGWWVSSDGTVYEDPADVPSGVADTYSVYRKVTVPSATGGLDYTGSELVGVPEGEGYVLSGTWKATEIGEYEAVATLEDGFAWADGTTDPITISWSIAEVVDPDDPDEPGGSGGQVIPTPPSGGDLVFTGEDQVGVPQGEGYVVSGTWHATDPGTYEAIVTPEEGYTWEDGTDDPAVIDWSIADDEEAGSEDVGDEAHGHWLPSWFWRLLPWILAVVGVAAVAWLFTLVVRARSGHGRHWRR